MPPSVPVTSPLDAGEDDMEQDSQYIVPPGTQPMSPLHQDDDPGVNDDDRADSGIQERVDPAETGYGHQRTPDSPPPNFSLPPPIPNDTPPIDPDLSRVRSMSNSQGNLSRLSSEEERGELMKGMKTIGKSRWVMHSVSLIVCIMSPGRVHAITKNLQRQVQAIIDHLQKQDTRLGDIEDAHKAIYSHFVHQRQKAKAVFPLRTVQEVLDFADAGDFEHWIAL